MGKYASVILKKGKESSLDRFHPWIFSGAIQKIHGNPSDGDTVEVFTLEGQYKATGHYQGGSIAVRVISFEQIQITPAFWEEKTRRAYQVRASIGLTDNPLTNTYRLVHGEGDGLPGLIVDYYNGCAVMQMHSLGMHQSRAEIAKALKTVLGDKLHTIYQKSEGSLPFKAGDSVSNEYFLGNQPEGEVKENGNTFVVNWEEGQKTGFFLDQRDNRSLLGKYCKDKRVLNMFGYTGGFSVYALQGGCALVHTVDSSKKAIELTTRNIQLNKAESTRHQEFVADAFEFFRATDQAYEVIVLDPPAFAKHRQATANALQAYKRLNATALKQIAPGGILFTFSCSQVISREAFRLAVFSAAAIAKRQVRILHQLTQPADHPVNIYHPEGEYLKGLVLHVE